MIEIRFGITIKGIKSQKIKNGKRLTRREKIIAAIEKELGIKINALRKPSKSSTIYLSNSDLEKIYSEITENEQHTVQH